MSKQILKTWFGICDFEVIESFKSVEAAAKQISPGPAALYKVNSKRVSFNFARVREESYDDKSLAASSVATKNGGEAKKVSKHKDNET